MDHRFNLYTYLDHRCSFILRGHPNPDHIGNYVHLAQYHVQNP